MADPALLQLEGSQPKTAVHFVPLSMQKFFSGLWTQRSPFNGPDNRYNTRFLGGRPEMLIDGLNVELTNYGTIIRRPGFIQFSTVKLNGPALTFFSFPDFNNFHRVIADTATQVSYLGSNFNNLIFTKSPGAGQSYFQNVGNTLYFGDGIDAQAWNPSISNIPRNWGIAIGSINSAVGPNAPASGTDVPVVGSSVAWTNPGNITVEDGNFATITLAPSGAGGNVSGSCGAGSDVGGGSVAWTNPNNISVNGISATAVLAGAGTTSNFLRATNFGFNIPANAIIQGIKVTFNREASTFGELFTTDWFLVKGGVQVGTNHAPAVFWGTTFQPEGGGGDSTDLWGTTWTPSDINASNFGFQIRVEQDTIGSATASILGQPVITVYYTIPSSGTVTSDLLEATNFGFTLPFTNTVNGILVEVKGFQTQDPNATLSATLLKAGTPTGLSKKTPLPATNGFISYGGSSDLWGTNWSPNDVNQTTFGVALQAINSSGNTIAWSADFVRITISGTGGPSISLQTGNGPLFAINGGWEYVFAYGNSNSGHISSPTPQSLSTGNFGGTGFVSNTGATVTLLSGSNFITGTAWNGRTISINGTNYVISAVNSATSLTLTTTPANMVNVPYTVGYASVQVSLTASTDPQVNQIHVYRTKDGGSVYFELPNSPFPNTTANIQDTSLDAGLQNLIFWPTIPPAIPNNPPPAGFIKYTFHLNRIWGVMGNTVFYSAGPDVLLGNGNEAFPPANNFTFPSQVNRLLPISSGLLVFTSDDVYIIYGTSTATFYPMPFQQGVGLLSWNALDVQGSNIFLHTADRQFLQFSSAGINEIGYAIGDLIETNIDPSKSYVASLISGTRDKAVFLADGSSFWFRCNWNQPPEGGPAWSPKANINGGIGAIAKIETSPGIFQLLAGQPDGTVLARSYDVFSDNGSTYGAFITVGSLVLAQPGQLANVQSITTEFKAVSSVPSVSVLLEEISGVFESLQNKEPDPPGLIPSSSVFSNRYYLTQGQDCIECRHMQIRLDFASEAAKSELLTLAVFGALKYGE